MQLKIVENYEELSILAAEIVAEALCAKKDSVLGLATGSTPEGMYRRLTALFREKALDFSAVTTFNLDEYENLLPDHPQSYSYYMRRHFFDHVNLRPENTHIPNSSGQQPEEACRHYDDSIRAAGGIDLQILGIGTNGHIGFNEPGSFLKTATHIVELSPETIEANSRFFESAEAVPRRAITMGLGPIMHAGRVVLLASGKSKAQAIAGAMCGKISTLLPASLLQLHHNATIIADKQAAALIP